MSEFDKIIGYNEIKNELIKIVKIIKNDDLRKKFDIRLPKGILLYGRPGVGKTMMSWAFIKELGFPVFYCKKDRPNGEFINFITQCFDDAKKNAPAIVFFDDIDKFSEDASELRQNSEEAVAIQTGFESVRNSDVIVIATANRKYLLPDSLLRSGRFDKTIHVNLPTGDDLVEIIKSYLKNAHVSDDMDYEQVANMLNGNSCADLEEYVNEAAMSAALDGSEQITSKHLIDVIAKKYSDDYSNCLKNDNEKRKRVAYHEAGHALIAMLSKSVEPCFVSASGYDNEGVCETYMLTSEQSSYDDFIETIKVGLAGKAAEDVVFNEKSMGVETDLRKISDLLTDAIEEHAIEGFQYIKKYGETHPENIMQNLIEKKDKIFTELYGEVKVLIRDNIDFVHKVAAELMEKKYLIHSDLMRIKEQVNLK